MLDEKANDIGVEFDESAISDPDNGIFEDEQENSATMSEDLLGPPPEDISVEPEEEDAPEETAPQAASTPVQEATTQKSSSPVRMDRATAAKLYLENRDARQSAASYILTFASAAKAKNVLEGTISGVITEGKEVCWTIYQGDITVRIPYAESYMILEDALLKDKHAFTLERQRQLMTKSIGLTVPFVVESFVRDPRGEGYIAYASRRVALERRRKVRYFGPTASQKVEVGSNVLAQVISFGANAAWVCACGMDIRVPNYLLSHRYIDDVSRHFDVGQEIMMRVTRMENNPMDEFMPTIHLSARPVEVQRFKPNLRRICGDHPRFRGTITSLRVMDNRNGPRVVVNLFLDGVEAPAFASTGHLYIRDDLKSGDKVVFEAWGKTENGYVHGKIIRYIHGGRTMR